MHFLRRSELFLACYYAVAKVSCLLRLHFVCSYRYYKAKMSLKTLYMNVISYFKGAYWYIAARWPELYSKVRIPALLFWVNQKTSPNLQWKLWSHWPYRIHTGHLLKCQSLLLENMWKLIALKFASKVLHHFWVDKARYNLVEITLYKYQKM